MTSLDFAEAARRLGAAARSAGHVAPGFRSPPRVAGCSRSIRRRRNGQAVVAVSLKGRPIAGVVADMVDGVVAANCLDGARASELRDLLWTSVAEMVVPATDSVAEVRPFRAA